MNSRQIVFVVRWLSTLAALAGIILIYRRWLHVNPTTVALTLVLFILLIAARVGLRYAVVVSVIATACYNFYFLPPVGTFVVADPENWLALFTFLTTGVIGSRLSQKARDEADLALKKQRELELLFALSRDLLQTDKVAELVNALPTLINAAAQTASSTLYLLEGDRVYQAGIQQNTAIEIPHLRQSALTLTSAQVLPNQQVYIPLRAGVRPRGLLRLDEVRLSEDTLQAIGDLASIAIDRAQALLLAPTCTDEVALGEEGTPLRLDVAVPPEVLQRIRFRSSAGERGSKHLVEGRLKSVVSLQGGAYRLSEASAREMKDVLLNALASSD